MSAEQATLIERLCQAGSPRNHYDWEKEPGYYVAACRVSADDIPGLIDIVRKWSDKDWPGKDELALLGEIDEEDAKLLPVSAWRTLGDMKADAAVQPLIELLRQQEEFDDWTLEELPHVFSKIGPSAIEPLLDLARDKQVIESARSTAVRALRMIAALHTDARDRIAADLTEMMANAVTDDLDFNTTLLVELVELKVVEAAEPIERAFAADKIDVGMMGDWESVRRELGVQGLGLPMPKDPHNCMLSFRRAMGLESASSQPRNSSHQQDDFSHIPLTRTQRVGRNEPCPCGSGKKFKKCCGGRNQPKATS